MSLLKHWGDVGNLFRNEQGEEVITIGFALGHLTATTRLLPTDLLPTLQHMQTATKKKQLSKVMCMQVLQIIEEFPQQLAQINRTLIDLAQQKPVDFVQWVESHYHEVNPNRHLSHPQPQPNEQVHIQQKVNGKKEVAQEAEVLEAQTLVLQAEKRKAEQDERRDLQIARRMQEEWGQEAGGSKDEQALCEICYVGLYDEEVELLDKCGHSLHKNCLQQAFKSNIINNNFPLRCPVDECQTEAAESDLKAILTPAQFEKYQSHTLKSYADQHGGSVSWCPTPNCGYMFFFQEGDQQRFECLQCKKEYCLNCRVEWHKNMTCKQYKISNSNTEQDQKFLDFVKGKKFKQCPRCKFWVEKNDGCDHMTCKCKFEFCYKCGGVYMKCQCMEQARKQMERRRQIALERAQRRKEKRSEALRQQREAKKQAREAQRLAKKLERERLKEEKSREKSKGRGSRGRR